MQRLFRAAIMTVLLTLLFFGVKYIIRSFTPSPEPIAPLLREEVTMTVPEGFTLEQIGARVVATFPVIALTEWRDAVGITSSFATHPFVAGAEKPDSVDLEGYLFPDTYRFYVDASLNDIVQTLLLTMQQRITALGSPTGPAAEYSVHELLTIASILEREVRSPEDMQEVADILYKRLAIGMALQCDSTVNYVTGGTDPSISLNDRYGVDSPYNTYMYKGLPPGPISNPGFTALSAAWHPSDNDFYYFLTDSQGRVHYAETFDEHVKNKYTYLP